MYPDESKGFVPRLTDFRIWHPNCLSTGGIKFSLADASVASASTSKFVIPVLMAQ
jgi:hypothetical protein